MKIAAIDVFQITLPFRFSFGHNLASRSSSDNLIVRVTLDNGIKGYGEGIPRDYVTGEDIDSSISSLQNEYAPRFINLDISSSSILLKRLKEEFLSCGLHNLPRGATWCALELAILDAVARAHKVAVADWLGPVRSHQIRYGAVVPFCGRKSLLAMLAFYRLYGFQTIKVKVGRKLEDDLDRLKLVRQIMGPAITLRVDANCAWTADEALRAAQYFRSLGVASLEQPVAADDLAGLARITANIPEEVIADESLCTVNQARQLAQSKSCSGFNIRISKVGGLLAAKQIAGIASDAGITCHLGAQVGESGILSSAGRILGCTKEPFANYEGSDNFFLLKSDLTAENLTVGWKGYGKLLPGYGLGVTVVEERLQTLGHLCKPPIQRSDSLASPAIPGSL